jgi:hypothetical protein
MSLESLSTEFSMELSRYLDSAVDSELHDISFESCSTIRHNARDTNQISMRMDQINQELEDIKQSFNPTIIKRESTKTPTGTCLNHLDRFDSIPGNIKAYIRQEIQCLTEKLPELVSQIIRQELDHLKSNPTATARPRKSPVKVSKPAWDNQFTSGTISSRLKRN